MNISYNATKVFAKVQYIKLLQKPGLIIIEGNKGCLYIKCPSYYFYQVNDNNFKLIFNLKVNFSKFWSNLKITLKRLEIVYFLKLKLKGLGYRFKKISKYFFRFYFTRTNYIYFHKPMNVLLKSRKKRIIILSSNKQVLHMIFNHMLMLHTVGPYNRRGFTYPNRIVLLKPGKKIF